MVAQATRAEGKFSLSLEHADVPLNLPMGTTAAGTLAIETAEIGPGPLPQQFLGVVRQLRTFLASGTAAGNNGPADGWIVLPKQDVVFSVRDGFVENKGLTMSLGDVSITTAGSVGIETQQINLVASIPLQDSWIQRKDGLLDGLKGQPLRVPITGTLSQPHFNLREFEDLGKKLAGAAARKEINKQVDKALQGENGLLKQGEKLLPGGLGQGINQFFGPKTTPKSNAK
jgi:translocation and assembly module TamB